MIYLGVLGLVPEGVWLRLSDPERVQLAADVMPRRTDRFAPIRYVLALAGSALMFGAAPDALYRLAGGVSGEAEPHQLLGAVVNDLALAIAGGCLVYVAVTLAAPNPWDEERYAALDLPPKPRAVVGAPAARVQRRRRLPRPPPPPRLAAPPRPAAAAPGMEREVEALERAWRL